MIRADQNSIHKVLLNLKYSGKATAVKSNILIESIFNSHIFPELEKAVSNSVPGKFRVELSKLEIDIGSIDENNLSSELPGRIASSISKALPNTLISKINTSSATSFTGSKAHDFLNAALEAYLTTGYFPAWSDPALTLEDAVTFALQEDKIALLHILSKICLYNNAAKRLVYGVTTQLFDKLLLGLLPVDGQWVVEYRKFLVNLKKETGNPKITREEFICTLNLFILTEVIKEPGVRFNRTRFSDSIVEKVIQTFRLNPRRMLQTSKETKGAKSAISRIKKSLAKQKDMHRLPASVEELLRVLNADQVGPDDLEPSVLRKQVLAALRNPTRKAFLLNKLNETGAIRILKIYDPKKGMELVELISAFKSYVVYGKLTTTVKELADITMSYLFKSALRELTREEYVLFLMHKTDMAMEKSIDTPAFIRFAKHQQLSLVKMHSLLKAELHFPEIGNFAKALEEGEQEKAFPGRKNTFNRDAKVAFYNIYNQKIIWNYLATGYLPEAYHDTTRNDVLGIFRELLHRKDPSLLRILRQYKNSERLVQRLEVLYDPEIFKETSEQLPHELLTGSKRTQASLYQLYILSPQLYPAKVDSFYWKRLVLRFILRSFVTQQEYPKENFASAFMVFLRQQLIEINAELFEKALERMKNSRNKELRGIAAAWDASHTKGMDPVPVDKSIIEQEEPEAVPGIRKANYYSGVIRFYTERKFLPWWAREQTIARVLQQLILDSLVGKKLAEEVFALLASEKRLLETSIRELPVEKVRELTKIISASGDVQAKVNAVLQKLEGKKSDRSIQEDHPIQEGKPDLPIDLVELREPGRMDKGTLFKSLYHLEDRDILRRWEKENTKGARQLNKYLMLAPRFYFKDLSPLKWRKMVYKFGLSFFGTKIEKNGANFDREFLTYLKENYRHIDWINVFTTVYEITHKPGLLRAAEYPKGLIKLIQTASTPPDDKQDDPHVKTDLFIEDSVGGGAKIFNAGMILLWPFFTRFFEHLSLLDNGLFKDEKGRYKAVYLLQYLVYNSVEFQESELVLNKVLAGLSPQDHLSPFIKLNKNEKELAQSLLGGFIGNWEKMKTSSPEAIQETFLQREGILQFKKDKILLRVDKKGVDVLLTSIPWNISLVKLTWMQHPLYVEWI